MQAALNSLRLGGSPSKTSTLQPIKQQLTGPKVPKINLRGVLLGEDNMINDLSKS